MGESVKVKKKCIWD